MSAKEQIKQLVDYFKKEPQLKDKTDAMGDGLMLGASLADEANERSVETEDAFKRLQQEYTENGNGAQSTAELIAARDGEQVINDRLNRDFGKVNAQLDQKASINYVDALLMDIAKGGPKGLFNSLALLKTEYPNGTEGTWLVFDNSFTDGAHSFIWDSTVLEWRDLGVYQATGLDKDTQRKLNDSYKGINEIASKIEVRVGWSHKEVYEASHPTSSWYGWKNGFKPMSFKKIVLKDNVTQNVSTYTCQVMTRDSEIVAEQTISSNGNGENIEIIFTFPEIITMTEDFFIAIKSSEFVSFVATAGYNSMLVSDSLMTSGWLNGSSWSDLGNFSHIMQLEFLTEEFKVNELITDGLGTKVLSDNGTYKSIDELENGPIISTPLETIEPRHLYSVRNDLNKDRNYPTTIYVDHAIKALTYNMDINFPSSDYKGTVYPKNLSSKTETENITIPYISRTYAVTSFDTVLRKSKLSATVHERPRILALGDSNIYGDQNTDFERNRLNFVSRLGQMFEMDKIDNSGIGGAIMLGETNKYSFPINYKEETYNVNAFTSGRSGWTAYGFSNHLRNYYPNQTNWDLFNLGDGSGTDYTGSQAQKDQLARTVQNSAAYPNADENRMIWNGYFDNNKTGDTKFSLSKWLERFRTLDDDGNPLTLGNGTGTFITAENINSINACLPTHVIIQLGQNDLDQGISNPVIVEHVRKIVNSIKSEYPEITVLVAYADRPGTTFPNAGGYPLFDCRINRGAHDRTFDLIKLLMAEFSQSEEAQGVYFCPNYFTQATADGMSYHEVIDPINGKLVGKVKSDVFGPDAHPSWHACADWAYQVYSVIRWQQSISI